VSTVVTGDVSSPQDRAGFGAFACTQTTFHEVMGAAFAVRTRVVQFRDARVDQNAAHWLIALPILVGFIFVAFSFTSYAAPPTVANFSSRF
jgi:hypothetical protein